LAHGPITGMETPNTALIGTPAALKIESQSSRSPLTSLMRSDLAVRAFAPLDSGFRVTARIEMSEISEAEQRASMTAPPCFPVAPMMRIVFAMALIPARLVRSCGGWRQQGNSAVVEMDFSERNQFSRAVYLRSAVVSLKKCALCREPDVMTRGSRSADLTIRLRFVQDTSAFDWLEVTWCCDLVVTWFQPMACKRKDPALEASH